MNPKAPFADCEHCTLRNEPFVPSYGSIDPDAIIIVGEAPGADEVKLGKPFVGPSGKLLDSIFKEVGANPEKTFRTNVVACRPPQNREPAETEIHCCSQRLAHELINHKSSTVMALGKTAANWFFSGYRPSDRGMWGTWNDKNVLPSWHPAYILRKPSEASELMKDVRVAREGFHPSKFLTPPAWHHVQTVPELEEWLAKCPPDNRWVGFDIETDQIQWYDRPGHKADAILCLQIAWEDSYGIVVDDSMLYDVPGCIETLQRFFDRKDVRFCAHNAQFDMVFLRAHCNLRIRCDGDTLLMHYILDENSKHGMKLLAKEEFHVPDYEVNTIRGYLTSANDRYSKIPFPDLAQYGVWDVVIVRALAECFEERLKSEGLWEWPFTNLIHPFQRTAVDMEIRGIQVDIPYLRNAYDRMTAELERVTQILQHIAGRATLNPNSPAQLADVIYNQLGMPRPKSPKISENSTAHEAIEKLKGKHDFIDQLLYFRRVDKLRGSYVENMLEFADCNGRVHPDILIYGTEVGRISMKNPAMMTIPRPTSKEDLLKDDYNPFMDGAIIRGAIIAADGHVILLNDYSQAELRVAAALAQEPFLLEAYRNGRDIHSEVAIGMYGPGYTKEQRVRCKMFNFSYLYGGSEYSFAMDAGLPVNVAREFVHNYNKVMPRLAAFRLEQFHKLVEQGYVQSPFGRRRRFTLITNLNVDEARKSSVHAPVAGTASDLTLMSATELNDNGVSVVLTVHDSIAADEPKERSREVLDYIDEVMLKTGEKYIGEVPWKTDPEIRQRWAEPPTL